MILTFENGQKFTFPGEITKGDNIEEAKKIQQQALDLMLKVSDLAYKYWTKQLKDNKVNNKYIKKVLTASLADYKEDDDSTKIIFILQIMSMGDAEGNAGDEIILPFMSDDASIVISKCNNLISHLTPEIAKLEKLI